MMGPVWRSPLLDVQFDMRDETIQIVGNDGRPFRSTADLTRENDELIAGHDEIAAELARSEANRSEVAAERDRLLAQLRAAGIEPKP